MEEKCFDLLLVDRGKSPAALVIAPSNEARVNDFVEFNNGKLGMVLSSAFCGTENGDMHNLLKQLGSVYYAEAVYSRMWCKEKNNHAEESHDSCISGGEV